MLEENADGLDSPTRPVRPPRRRRAGPDSDLSRARALLSGLPAGAHVMLVEDDPIFADELALRLIRHGLAVVGPATGVAEALALLRKAPLTDAALLDTHLEDELVYPVAEVLSAVGIPYAAGPEGGGWSEDFLHIVAVPPGGTTTLGIEPAPGACRSDPRFVLSSGRDLVRALVPCDPAGVTVPLRR